jgi:hypothetical protein
VIEDLREDLAGDENGRRHRGFNGLRRARAGASIVSARPISVASTEAT